jgi:eukaryotic-like serine/threonine-protein kinase
MLPERFGRYEVLDKLGEGAMGRVYRAWDPGVSRVVAVKTLKTDYLTRETADEYLKRFRREAQSAGGLNHPAVVRIFDLGDDYLVMEYVEGRTLHRVIREEGRLAPEAALRLIAPVAEAVDHAHRAGIVHRDIKPANIMVQPNGQPKLMDFGVARIEASVMTTAGEILGSPSYMSPEQIAGETVTSRSDVYSLAVVAYEMLTGQPPFQGKTITQVIYSVMHDPPPPPRQWNAALPARYDDIFARALAKDPAVRFATAGEFAAALDVRELEYALSEPALSAPAPRPAGADSPTVVSPGPAIPTAPGPAWRAPALVAAMVAVLGAVGWLALRGTHGGPVPEAATPAPLSTLGAAAATPPAPLPSPASPFPTARPARAAKVAATPVRQPSATPAPTPEPVVEGQLVEMGPGVTPPSPRARQSAPYPDRARRLHLYGTVTIALIVDEAGTPTDLRVVESAGPILDEAVLKAVRNWRFEPARKDGVRVKMRWQVRQTYRAAR